MSKHSLTVEPFPGVRSQAEFEFTVTRGSVSVDPPSINATSRGSIAVTVTGVSVGDVFIPEFNNSINDDLVFMGAKVTATNQVTFYFYNPTGGSIDDAAQVWSYTWIKLV
jgi:hypothetical protein